MNQRRVRAGIRFLEQAGLNLVAVLDCAALPETTAQIMRESGVPLDAYRRLVLLGHGGKRMWRALQKWGLKTADPVDYYSTTVTHQFVTDYLDNPPILWLYPDTQFLIPLQQLGELAGWSHPSPLGQGINPTYGVWFAYRAAFLTTAELPLTGGATGPSPCDACSHKPCLTACPAGAVQPARFDIEACACYRLQPGSVCADRCLARMACPYFPEHRYSLEQIRHHYGRSLETLAAWYGTSG
jgi:epoxyqueuosine reductase